MKTILTEMKQHPVRFSLELLLGLSLWLGIGCVLATGHIMSFFAGILIGMVLIYPFLLTVANLVYFLMKPPEDERILKSSRCFERITIVLGAVDTLCLSMLVGILTPEIVFVDWSEQLYNRQVHTPVWTQAVPTVLVLGLLGVAGYLVLSFVKLDRMPPLVIVTAIAAMYLGIFESLAWVVQVRFHPFLCLYPVNCIMIAVKVIRYKVKEWNEGERQKRVYEGRRVLSFLEDLLDHAAYWPLLAFVAMLPLLGLALCVLALFGQKPDYWIKAWTQTADWTLSLQEAPPNLFYDEHYLCTVAAGGHAKIVKPIRMGERHGHRVVVNRQLCIANAFEQILEERTPRFHRCVRRFYDTCGFPAARLIKTKTAADLVYFLMKPLEWIFLIVLYFCDVKPENRIAVQYLPGAAKAGERAAAQCRQDG